MSHAPDPVKRRSRSSQLSRPDRTAGERRGSIWCHRYRWSCQAKRIYLTGLSNGGFMSHRMACDHADLIAAVAPLAGVTFLEARLRTVIAPVGKRSGPFYDRGDSGFMTERPRIYTGFLQDHLERHRQMVLVSGPRQAGKTTVCRSLADAYLNWDNTDDRRQFLRGPAALAQVLELDRLRARTPVAVFDELHKYRKWKTLLKGLFDTHGGRVRLVVTGSSRLDIFRRGGDSLMGRYLLYRMHPWSVGESVRTDLPAREVQPPAEVASACPMSRPIALASAHPWWFRPERF